MTLLSRLLRSFAVNPSPAPPGRRQGFSLIEVVIATAILGVSLAVLLTAASKCLLVLSIATHYQEAQLVRGQAEMEFPLIATNDLDELNVPLTTMDNGLTFERIVEEEDEDEDDLHVIRTRVGWSARGESRLDEIVQYIYFVDEEKDE
ncbi:MAG: prepilin-type N-terminal cleavage/methylation domain-containing protein [Lentisphaerae bacterium]|nr:prepilin-type N-terminal cleavage/methylation domain-containing protein [Lentisphaerota bacterium]